MLLNLRDHQLKIIIHMFLHMNLMVTIIQKSITDTYRKRVKRIQTHTTIIQSNKNTKINKTKKNKTIASGNFKDFLKAGMEGEVGAMIKGSS